MAFKLILDRDARFGPSARTLAYERTATFRQARNRRRRELAMHWVAFLIFAALCCFGAHTLGRG